MNLISFLGAFLLAACLQAPVDSLEQPLDPTAKSGTRLVAQVKTSTFSTPDGFAYKIRGDITFHDNVLNHDCVIPDISPSSFCAPIGDATFNGWYAGPQWAVGLGHSPEIYVSPKLHSGPAGQLAVNSPSNFVFAVYDATGKGDPSKWFGYVPPGVSPATMGIEQTATVVYWCYSGSCDHFPPPAGWRFFQIGPPAPISMFARVDKTDATEILP